jgi:hypothetical protein
MLLNKNTFSDVRTDTYALFVDDLGLYYHYAKALLDEFIKEVDLAQTTDVASAEAQLNSLLTVIRETHGSRTKIVSEEVKAVLEAQDLDADDLTAVFRSGSVSVEGHTQTDAIKECPLPISAITESKISSTREAIAPQSDLMRVDGEASTYVSAGLVASMVGGTVRRGRALASGTDTATLQNYIESFSDNAPVLLQVRIPLSVDIDGELVRQEPTYNFVLDNTGLAFGGTLAQAVAWGNILSWVSVRETVKLTTPGVGTSGPMFEYPLSTSIVDNSLSLRPGMCLVKNTSVVVSKVLGERVTLTTPVSTYGTLAFVYKSCASWGSYSPLLSDIKVEGDTEEERANSFLSQAQKRKKTCSSLLSSIPASVNEKRFDIRAAHHAVGADYAYNLLEHGRLIEYHQLTEQQANRGSIMSTAAAHIRAGTRL